jgi:hypothetical protein
LLSTSPIPALALIAHCEDTIDLQDQSSPSAQDHSRSPYHQPNLTPGPAAPHQAAELRHVRNERAAEEVALSHGWNGAHNLSDEPPSEDDDMYLNGNHLNGDNLLAQHEELVGNSEDHSMEDDGEDSMDDDGMDKISSSPSISDGGSSRLLWPRRTSSLTPVPSPMGTPIRAASGNFDSSPLSASNRPLCRVLSDSLRRTHLPSPVSISSQSTQSCNHVNPDDSSSSSPFTSSPKHFPLERNSISLTSYSHHHSWSEYPESEHPGFHSSVRETSLSEKVTSQKSLEIPLENIHEDEERDTVAPLYSSQFDKFRDVTNLLAVQKSPLEQSPSDMDLDNYLLPKHDPILESIDKIGTTTDSTEPNLSTVYTATSSSVPISSKFSSIGEGTALLEDSSSDSDWTDASESDDDSFDSFTFNDDDAKSFQSSVDPMFYCSGWSGECLQELEDIDFEFVYALHNFVATVEGQANAAKGDTMVLLDDSNSYWWLVRVVKDSTIGSFNFSPLVIYSDTSKRIFARRAY